MYKLLTFYKSSHRQLKSCGLSFSWRTPQNLVELAGLGRLLHLLSLDLELRALVLANGLGVGLLRVDPELAIGLARAGQPLAVCGVGAVVVQVDLVLLGAHQGEGALGGPTRGTRGGQGQEAIGCAGNVDVCLERCQSLRTKRAGKAGRMMRGRVVCVLEFTYRIAGEMCRRCTLRSPRR